MKKGQHCDRTHPHNFEEYLDKIVTLRSEGNSWTRIGKLLNRDHSTVLSAAKKYRPDIFKTVDMGKVYTHVEQHRKIMCALKRQGVDVAVISKVLGSKCLVVSRQTKNVIKEFKHPYKDILESPVNRGKTYEEYLKIESERKKKIILSNGREIKI